MHSTTLSVAPDCNEQTQTFSITHPFHPFFGQSFALVSYRNNWGENRVYFRNSDQTLVSIPVGWTDLRSPDLFLEMSKGRSVFHFQSLVELVAFVEKRSNKGEGDPDEV